MPETNLGDGSVKTELGFTFWAGHYCQFKIPHIFFAPLVHSTLDMIKMQVEIWNLVNRSITNHGKTIFDMYFC